MQFDFILDGKRMIGHSQWVSGQLWIHLNGKTFLYESPSTPKQKRRGQATDKAGDLAAPMPGKITKVLGKKGQEVFKGDPILVMEAMKMEYTLKAEGPGLIEAIECKVGDQVTLGKVLVRLKPHG